MDELFKNEMKEALEIEQADLQQELDFVSGPDDADHMPGDRVPDFPNYGDDALDENSASPEEVAQYTLNMNVTTKLEEKLHAVNDALERIENGLYGECISCGDPIPVERLEANPSAAECMNCAE